MFETTPRLLVQATIVALVTALAGGVAAQDRPVRKAPAAKSVKKRPAKRAQPSPQKKRGALTKKQRDARDDALFEGGGSPEAKKRPRPPVSTAGPWPAEDDSPWPTEDDSPWPADHAAQPPSERVSPQREDELFGDLEDDMESPADKREAEERGSTRPQGHHHPVPSPDANAWEVQASAAPEVLEWEEGADVPDGYEQATRVRKGLVITGAVLFGVSWLATAGYGTWLINQREPDYWERRTDDGARPEAVLYIPLVGPWIALGTVEHDDREGAAFVTGGLVQAGSLAMLIAGVAAKETILVKTESAQVGVAPTTNGGVLNGKF